MEGGGLRFRHFVGTSGQKFAGKNGNALELGGCGGLAIWGTGGFSFYYVGGHFGKSGTQEFGKWWEGVWVGFGSGGNPMI